MRKVLHRNGNSKIKEKLKSTLVRYINILILALSVILVISLINNINRIRKSGERVSSAEQKLEDLKAENKTLKARIETVESDFFIETQLRDKLGLSKEGEIVVVLPEDDVLRKFAPKYEEEETDLPDPNWKKWLKLFY